jgi:hypothetical protein
MEETTLQENERLYLTQEAQGFLKETLNGAIFIYNRFHRYRFHGCVGTL